LKNFRNIHLSGVWGFAFCSWGFALRASTPQEDPTGRVQKLIGLEAIRLGGWKKEFGTQINTDAHR
jgi:hypothetical protein